MAGKYDAIVVGAGVVGCPLAVSLARLGHRVGLIERDWAEPNRIVGELMQPGGVQALVDLGLHNPRSQADDPTDVLRGIEAIREDGYAVVNCTTGESVKLRYPQTKGIYAKNSNSHRDPPGPSRVDLGDCFEDGRPRGWSFHYGRFVMRLREAAKAQEGVFCLDGTAQNLVEDSSGVVVGVSYKARDSDTATALEASYTFVADGCFSNFRRKVGLAKPLCRSHFVGLILKDVPLPVPNCGNVFLAESGPILAYQLAPGEQRMLIDCPDPLPKAKTGELATYLRETVGPQFKAVAPDLYEAFITAVDDGDLRSMPNNQLHADPSRQQKLGLMLIGDSMNMRHPLTGGGMTVGLNDVLCMINILKAGPTEGLYDHSNMENVKEEFFHKRRVYSGSVNILAGALYSVFTAPPLMDAVYNYFKLGGDCQDSPMALLAGVAQQPFLLLRHFFMVAFYGMFRQARWIPWPWKIWRALRLLNFASWIVIPLMIKENIFKRFAQLLRFVFFLRPRGQLK